MQIRSAGIDLGKTTFHLVALGASGKGWMVAYGIDPKVELFPNVHDRTT